MHREALEFQSKLQRLERHRLRVHHKHQWAGTILLQAADRRRFRDRDWIPWSELSLRGHV
jgi:hypothetical protein